MPLAPGTRLGSYEIASSLGAGGMGEVYKARDLNLGRDVAIKILPAAFASDPERLARFEREARTLAGLNHPNIAQIYEMTSGSEVTSSRALVMELVAGEDLAARIARGPIALADAVPLARQIALAFEAAHDAGIIHRDLKPANVMVKDDGTVKVLDFGLAKALDANASGATADVANSPTLTAAAFAQGYGGPGTQLGMIIGTAAYMSPEQARGKAVDRRADVWAFGAVLYEMLTGRRVFEGEEISDVLAAVLRQDVDWTKLPADVPVSVRRLLRRCLEKDPRKRLSAIGDARLELEETNEPAPAPAPARALRSQMWMGIAGGALITAAVAAVLWALAPRPPAAELSRLTITAPEGIGLYSDPAEHSISPDGRMVVFVVGDKRSQGGNQIWIRSLDTLAARRLVGSDGGYLPFWSPDSRRVGFFAVDGKLKTAPVDGERADVVCDVTNGRGGAWSQANVIVFAPDGAGPLFKVSANGGEPAPVTTLDKTRQESGHRFPVFLPDGEHFLFASLPGKGGKFDIFAASTNGGAPELIGAMETSPAYAAPASGSGPGWLLFMRQGAVTAQRFDPRRRQLVGEAVSLADEPGGLADAATTWTAGQVASAAASGSLAYFTEPPTDTKLVYLDLAGAVSPSVDLPKGRYSGVSVSPDGSRAVVVKQTTRTESTLWLIDLEQGGTTPLSVARGQHGGVVWSPDSRRIVYMSDREGNENLFSRDLATGAPDAAFHRSPALFKLPEDWTRDGKWVIFRQLDQGTFQNIWALPASGDPTARILVQGPVRDLNARVSPDGKWLAYVSDESGRAEIYLQPFPESRGERVQLTTQGGAILWWKADNRGMVALDADIGRLLAIDIEYAPGPRAKPARPLGLLPRGTVHLDLLPERTRALALVPAAFIPGSITVVQNWQQALK